MRILAVVQGNWGRRKVDNIRTNGPEEWSLEVFEPPLALPQIIDDPDEFIPQDLPQADLLLYLGESPGTAQLVTDIAKRSGVRSAIAPIDNSAWLPPGLAKQLNADLNAMGISSVFPKPFCTLTTDSYNYRGSAERYENELIADFARHFGQPELKVSVDPDTKKIDKVDVVRDACCGNARYVAHGLVGVSADDAEFEAGMLHHHYPCLASMAQESIDERLTDTLMHVAGYIMRDNVGEQVKPFKKPVQYMTPDGYVSGEENPRDG